MNRPGRKEATVQEFGAARKGGAGATEKSRLTGPSRGLSAAFAP